MVNTAAKWLASKLAPKKCGDKVAAELSGSFKWALLLNLSPGRLSAPTVDWRLRSAVEAGSGVYPRPRAATPLTSSGGRGVCLSYLWQVNQSET